MSREKIEKYANGVLKELLLDEMESAIERAREKLPSEVFQSADEKFWDEFDETVKASLENGTHHIGFELDGDGVCVSWWCDSSPSFQVPFLKAFDDCLFYWEIDEERAAKIKEQLQQAIKLLDKRPRD